MASNEDLFPKGPVGDAAEAMLGCLAEAAGNVHHLDRCIEELQAVRDTEAASLARWAAECRKADVAEVRIVHAETAGQQLAQILREAFRSAHPKFCECGHPRGVHRVPDQFTRAGQAVGCGSCECAMYLPRTEEK